jgi:undecaprenyl-diphosphatase
MWSNFATRIDDIIIGSVTSSIGRSATFDGVMEALAHGEMVNGAFVMAIFWWYWFRPSDAATTQRTREHLLCTMIAAAAGLFVARALARTLPFRTRPRFEPALHFVWPAAPNSLIYADWSAFPSDHVVMFSALAVGLWYVSRRMGLALLLFAVFIVGFPRVYYGMHYPTDVLAGAALGAVFACCANGIAASRRLAGRILLWEPRSPQGFYVALFVVTFEFATMFNSVRSAAGAAFRALARLL